MPVSYRDIKQKQQKRLEQKQDKRNQFRAVIVDAQGNQSGAGSIWADQNTRRIWVMPVGGVQPFQILCVRITPVIGLGVICGYADAFSNQIEVLRTDYEFLGPSNTTGTAYESPSNLDFLPGGRLQLWLDGRLVQPLATYPDTSGLTVNVVAGEYIYDNTRKTFAGEVGRDLTASVPGTPGDYRYVGLYLDSNNSLQTVDGATSASLTPAEPTWPAGAFQLSMVRLTNGQTTISMADDVVNKRIFSSDVISFSGWPFANILTVSTTDSAADYPTIAAAITAASAGDAIWLDSETFTETVTVNKAITIFSTGAIITSASDFTVTITAAAKLYNLTITNSGTGAVAAPVHLNGASSVVIDNCTLNKSSGVATIGAGLYTSTSSNIGVVFRNTRFLSNAGTTRYGIYNTTFTTGTMYAGEVGGTNGSLISTDITPSIFVLDQLPLLQGAISFTGAVGWYNDINGNLSPIPGSGISSGVWLVDISTGFVVKYSTIAAAITAAASGDTVLIYPDTYDQSTTVLTIDKAITLLGTDPKNCIITGSASNNTTINVTVDNVRIENLTINHTGTGTGGAAVRWATNNLIIQNCYLNTTGAASGNYVYDHQGGSTTKSQILGCYGVASGATSNSGYVNTVAAALCDIVGGSISGATYDVYGNQSASVLTLDGVSLLNGTHLWSGILNWIPEAKIDKNLLYSSMTHNIWQEATTFNDIADDTYGPDTVWNVIHNGQAPDITGQAGGSTDPFTEYFRCTFDSAASQAGIVQFLEAEDTYPLRGQKVSLSFDAWGTNVVELRAAVLSWGSTANTLTSDVVGTWATNNPTLATNWSYANTPAADITISSTRQRYAVNNITIPTTANNLAVFIWTSAEEADTDLFNIARVQLERGPTATEFTARSYTQELLAINRFALVAGKITGSRFLGGRADATNVAFFGFKLPVEMVQVPAITLVNGSGNVRINDGLVNVNVSAISTNFSTKDSIGVNLTASASTLTVGRPIFIDFTATDTYLLFSARL